MRFRKTISILVTFIVILSTIASLYGIFSNDGVGKYQFRSIHNSDVEIYGNGLYKNDSVSTVAQGKAQDIVTIILGIPLLVISLISSRKNSLRGRFGLIGTIGYFLYTYISYSFLWMYNSFFLIYVALMSLSFFAFILTMMSFDVQKISLCFSEKFPAKFIGGFLIAIGISIGLLWSGIIVPPLLNGTVPTQLEHYTTLVIQAMDLGFVLPISIIAGILLIKRKGFGYLLATVIIVKGSTMLTSLTAMIIGQILAGVKVGMGELILFPLFNILIIYPLIAILKNIDESKNN